MSTSRLHLIDWIERLSTQNILPTYTNLFSDNQVNINWVIPESNVVAPITVEVESDLGEVLSSADSDISRWTTITCEPTSRKTFPRNSLIHWFALVISSHQYNIRILEWWHNGCVTDRLALWRLCNDCHTIFIFRVHRWTAIEDIYPPCAINCRPGINSTEVCGPNPSVVLKNEASEWYFGKFCFQLDVPILRWDRLSDSG